ncbi:MAG: hypothetical protein IJB92_06985 [Clostridia bacterium]|nr:hypothetical protein [Clostridia bacterium]
MKKKVLYIAALVICLSIITNGTLAYFTAIDTARNVITSGGVNIKVVEQQLKNGKIEPYANDPIKIMPASAVSKIVSVLSTNQAAWIRMNYTVTVFDANGKVMDIPAGELEKAVIIEPNQASWKKIDGWWYHKTAVESGEMTAPLFDSVSFSADMDNKYQLCRIEIDVNAQAVQKANNAARATEAVGWPSN